MILQPAIYSCRKEHKQFRRWKEIFDSLLFAFCRMSLQLDDELTCSVCLELYDCPLTLPCLHTFCSECLRELTQSSNGLTIVCPQCRVDTPIPIGGFGKFPKNFNLQNIIQKVKLHKEKEGSSNTEFGDPTQVNPSRGTLEISSVSVYVRMHLLGPMIDCLTSTRELI